MIPAMMPAQTVDQPMTPQAMAPQSPLTAALLRGGGGMMPQQSATDQIPLSTMAMMAARMQQPGQTTQLPGYVTGAGGQTTNSPPANLDMSDFTDFADRGTAGFELSPGPVTGQGGQFANSAQPAINPAALNLNAASQGPFSQFGSWLNNFFSPPS